MNKHEIIYSTYEEELKELSYKPVGVFDTLLHKLTRKISPTLDLRYSFSVPVSDYLRAELFCDDISEVTESRFTQRDLISLLLDDFLIQAKQRSNPYDLYRELDFRNQQATVEILDYSNPNKKKEHNHQSSTKTIECIIKRKEALRLEVMLSDIANLDETYSFTVQEVLKILYCDFIFKYKTGQLTNVMETIIKRMELNN